MDCPACRQPLIVAERDGIELDCCPFCRGLWFDAGELQLLEEKLGLPRDARDFSRLPLAETTEKPRLCPRCDRALEKVYADPGRTIIVDRCDRGHGLWFDHGELGRVLELQAGAIPGPAAAIVSFLGESFRRSSPRPAGEQEA